MRFPAHSVLAAAISATLLLVACGRNEPQRLIESARSFAVKKDYRSAIIELKGVVQKQPDSAEARLMLGQAYIDSGDAVAATIELRRARALKRPEAEVVPPLARALLATQSYKALTDEFGSLELTGDAGSDLKTSVSIAYQAQGQAQLAAAALADALRAGPYFARTLLYEARELWRQHRIDDAFARVDQVLQQDPRHLDGLTLKGDLLRFARKDAAAALETYRLAAKTDPSYLPGRSSVIAMLLDQRDFKAASDEITRLRRSFPDHPTPVFFEAQLAYLGKDNEKARVLTEQLLKSAPRNARVLAMAGAIALTDSSLIQAETYLVKALQIAPDLSPARQLLTQTYLKGGQTPKALATLQPLLSVTPPDAATLALAGEAYLQSGDIVKADENFAKAAKLNPIDIRSRTALAMSRLEHSTDDSGFAELRELAAADGGTFADLAIVSAHVRRGEFKAALTAIDALERKSPRDAMVPTLRGRVQVTLKDLPAARRSFEQALQLNSRFVAAAGSLAALDVVDRHPEQAQRRFEGVLKADPGNLPALLGLAGLGVAAGKPRAEIESLLVEAMRMHPGESVPRLLLVDLYLLAGDFNKALLTAQNATAALPDNLDLLDGLGRALLATGDVNQATAAFERLASQAPESTKAHMRLAAAYKAANNERAYLGSLTRALAIKPDLQAAQRALIEHEMVAKRPDKALAIARTIQKQHPESEVGYSLEGAIVMTQGNFADSVKAYRTAFARMANGQTAENLHKALNANRKSAEADRLSNFWLGAHPKDAGFLFYLGDVALSKQDYGSAEQNFRASIAANDANPLALNNLAWVLLKVQKPGALPLATRANELRPQTPQILDTLVSALAGDRQFTKAIEVQKQALALDASDATLRLRLAKLYIQAGTKDAARTELEALAKLGTAFAAAGEVARLLETL